MSGCQATGDWRLCQRTKDCGEEDAGPDSGEDSGPDSGCDSTTCGAGCCDGNGVCQAGTDDVACGFGGAPCAACQGQAFCGAGRFCEECTPETHGSPCNTVGTTSECMSNGTLHLAYCTGSIWWTGSRPSGCPATNPGTGADCSFSGTCQFWKDPSSHPGCLDSCGCYSGKWECSDECTCVPVPTDPQMVEACKCTDGWTGTMPSNAVGCSPVTGSARCITTEVCAETCSIDVGSESWTCTCPGGAGLWTCSN